jgi:signal transduction histidine kinase/DNA-binding response OmpR family regulator/ligand-binding sensor domain-containing protein
MIGPILPHRSVFIPSRGATHAVGVALVIVTLCMVYRYSLLSQDQLLPVFHFNHLSTRNGLPMSGVRAQVVRDRDGYVWVGTANGLARFDGYGCRTYQHIPDDPHSLPSNAVTSLLLDREQRLWVGTYETGLCLYDAAHDRFVNFVSGAGDSSSGRVTHVSSILEDHSGNLWLGSYTDGLAYAEMPAGGKSEDLDSLPARIRFSGYPLRTPQNTVSALCEQEDGKLLVASDSGLIIFDPQTRGFSHPGFNEGAGRQLDSIVVQALFKDTHGNLWVGTATQGIYQVDLRSMWTRHYVHREGDGLSIRSNDISGIVEDQTGYLWITSARGLDRFSPESGTCTPYLAYGSDPRSSTSMKIAIDGSGTLWIGKLDDGVYWLSPRSLRFPHFSIPTQNGWPRPFESIERDLRGNLWISSHGLIYQIDIAAMRVVKTIDLFHGKNAITGETDRNVSFLDAHGDFWYGTWGLGLYRVNLATGQVRNYQYPPKFGADCVARRLASGEEHCIWVAGEYEGLMKFDPSSGEFLRTQVTYASHVMKDRSGKIWVASDMGGLYVHDPSTGRTKRFAHDPSNPRSLSDIRTRLTYEDPSGRIWVAADAVINLWDPVTEGFTRYANRAFQNTVFAIPVGSDRKGRLWVSYMPGSLSILDPSSGVFTNFDFDDGVCGRAVDMENLEDGRVLLTGWAGINILDPDSLNAHRSPPPLVITRMAINDETVIPSQLFKQSGPARLSHLQNTLEFEFAAIDVDVPHLVQYSYQLEGLEKDWVTPKDRRYVRYASLPPGDYVFRVKAISSWGAWPDQERALAFRIAPPWWRTTWAYSFYALLIVSLLFAGYRLRLREVYMRQQAEMQRFQADRLAEVDRLKSRFFANISHEFRTPLTLILGPIRQAIERPDDPNHLQKLHLVENNTKKLYGLVNQLLDFSRIESGAMKLQVSRSDIVQSLRRIVMSFESWAESKKINLEFRSEAETADGFFDGDKLEKIVNNLMSNALKFTAEGGSILVSLRVAPEAPRSNLIRPGEIASSSPKSGTPRNDNTGRQMELIIGDTGMGITPEHLPHIFDRFYRVDETHTTEGTGIGLALTKELVDLHHGTITVESTQGKGSEFRVILPIEASAYRPEEIVESPPPTDNGNHALVATSVQQVRSVSSTPPAEGKPIVLVVEDNPDLRAYIREYLDPDYSVQEAANGREGYDGATELVPDIVISDVMMPEMDGMELCRALKQDVRTSHVPVILLTARAGTESKIEGLEIGADDYVTKPFDSKELVARVRNLIEQRRQLRKKFSAGVVLKPGEVAVTSIDDDLLKKVMEIVEKNISNEKFGVDDLAREVFLSRRHLYRKLQALTNLAPAEFIQYIRLQRGYELLEKNAGSIAEVAFQVGFGSPSHFSARFHERFGKTPSEVSSRDSAPRPESSGN